MLTRSDTRSMRPVTSPDMGERGGRPWRSPKLALWDGESLVLLESLLLGVILHRHAVLPLNTAELWQDPNITRYDRHQELHDSVSNI